MKISTREKYNVDNVFQLAWVKEKIKQASLEKYGVENPGNSREARIKAAETMRKNGNHSSWEDTFENKLKALNIKYEKQYDEDERYPFQCDFYLPNEDVFIEINGYWTHNNHFFDENNKDDIETLNQWKEKAKQGHKQFANAVEVWSNKDLLKRDLAIKNNLNYVVLWTLDDVLFYINYLESTYGKEIE